MSSVIASVIITLSVLPVSAIDFGMSEIKYRTYGALMPPKPATTTPCCVDTLTPGVCHSMLSNDHENFINMCRKNADFSFMQCCYTCHFSADAYTGLAPSGVELYNMDAKMLLLNPVSEFHKCSDRHSNAFCDSLLGRHGQWALKKISCDNASLAFRICRRTCGYCTSFLSKSTIDYNGTEARDMKKCMRLF
uniref:ShKT domain-containing protein n=1 Tax=Panagrellus redivivus TaxID=6233 RepID=A0A7E4ZUC4_PANRE